MPEFQRVQVLKIFGVTLTNGLLVSQHVHTIITSCHSCAQTLHELTRRWESEREPFYDYSRL